MEIRNSIMASFKSETSKSSTFINLGEKDLKAKFLKEKTWRELSHKERLRKVGKVALIAIAFFLLLILFFANISMMSAGIKIISGYHTRNIFEFANNEMAGLSIGIIATVIFQSSSTTTSLTVALVASNVLTVKYAIPIIMGANVGTSVTNTLVSLGHINDATQFRRAMQGATVHDFFNIFLVLIFLPTQMIPIYDGKGWMELLSYYLVMPLPKNSNSDTTKKLNFIKHMTEPYVNSFLKINKCLLKLANVEGTNLDQSNFFQRCIANCASKLCPSDFDPSQSNILISKCPRCSYYFKSLIESGILKSSKISDSASAGIAIAISLILIISSLFALTKLMSFALKKQTSNWIKRALLKNVVVGMLVGCVITIIIQSSSITTSSLVPLVALNVITVQQMFPVTLGANVGTTITAFLAAIGEGVQEGIQIAICHFLFNFFGILLIYPIPYFRSLPIVSAQALGYKISKNRLYGFLFISLTFFVIPGILLGLSFLKWGNVVGAVLLYSSLLFAYIWRQIRVRCPHAIPLWCPNFMKPNNREAEEAMEDLDFVAKFVGAEKLEDGLVVTKKEDFENNL